MRLPDISPCGGENWALRGIPSLRGENVGALGTDRPGGGMLRQREVSAAPATGADCIRVRHTAKVADYGREALQVRKLEAGLRGQ